ncbi:MAG: DUF3558 family protein, partial [Pseudonocardiaceae bacterium]
MRKRLVVLAAAVAVFVVLITAYGAWSIADIEIGEPSVAPPAEPTLPPRPREIDLTGVDTCTLLTPAQQQQLGTDRAPVATADVDRYGNTSCHYSKFGSSPRFSYSITAVPQEDATVYLTGARDVVARVVSAAGFPA